MILGGLWRRSLFRYLAALSPLSTATVSMVDNTAPDGTVLNGSLRRHRTFWFDDGSLILRAQDDLYKVHRTVLTRHSARLAAIIEAGARNDEETYGDAAATTVRIVQIPDELGVESGDVEALLEHLYHDAPLSRSPFQHAAAVLRASSRKQLDLPSAYSLARERIEALFPSEPVPHFHSDDADKALTLAVEYDIPSIQKSLFYSIATGPNLEHDDPDAPAGRAPSPDPTVTRPDLPPEVAVRCRALLDALVAHFTPILFTVATAHHMTCTDVLAEQWMPLVIAPALASNGLCRPLETLQEIIDLDWAAQGLCAECVREKREEWRGEQRAVWEAMDAWLGLEGGSGNEARP